MTQPASPTPGLDYRNTNSLWCSVLVETLARAGVREAVVSPGSRSTPLTFALAAHPAIAAVPVLDERSAAFFALGRAKRTHLPVVLVCTSGTAGANYLPAIVEARESGTPLLVITADRPPEMRECASGQTIDQQKLFAGHVVFYHELAVPGPDLRLLRYLRQTAAHAVGRALQPVPGPVHLNAPFRDPLPPIADSSTAGLAASLDDGFFSQVAPPAVPHAGTVVWQRPTTTRGLIVAGAANPVDRSAYAAAVLRFADALGWPVLADALSPVRHHAGAASANPPVVSHYDVILRDRDAARDLAPRQVICLDNWPTSKALRAWLERLQPETVLVAATAANRDALHGRTRHIAASVEQLAVEGRPPADAAYREAWSRAEAAAGARLDAALDGMGELFEGKAAWLLGRHLPPGANVFVAGSMPVRDVEYFWPAGAAGRSIHFNRGANGIDGTLSTALGVAHGGAPAVLLTGDLALLHDTNGFLIGRKFRGSLTVVLINNRGGGIFEHLPVAQFDPPFEEFFATPQEVDFAALCAAYGVEHVPIGDWAQFQELISVLPAAGIRVLELQTDRKRDAATRGRLLRAPDRSE